MELPQTISGEKIALKLNNLTQKLNFMFCGLGEERTKIRKIKKEKISDPVKNAAPLNRKPFFCFHINFGRKIPYHKILTKLGWLG